MDWSADVCSSDLDIITLLEPFFFQHAHGGASVRVGHADDGTRAFRPHGGINGMLGHQVGNELIAVAGIEGVGFLKGHAEEAPGDPVPKGRRAGLINNAPSFAPNSVAKDCPALAGEDWEGG